MSTEKKIINYDGMELECVDSGYWPDGIDMLCTDVEVFESDVKGIVCLQSGVAFLKDGCTTSRWKYWAILPQKPAPPRLTNRQLFNLCQNGYAILFNGSVFGYWNYSIDSENNACSAGVTGVRSPNSDEWLEPTRDLLEVWE